MAQYLISVWHDDHYDVEVDFSSDDMQRKVAQVGELNEDMQAKNVWVFGGGLLPTSSATTLRPNNGQVSMTDGPFAETKEQMGGFWVIDVPDLDQALEWSRRAALACEENLELRPFQGE